jgi:putative flippase GtrA
VSLVGGLYQRFRHLIHEGGKFLVVGGFGFLVTELVFNLLISEHQATFTANAVATLVAAAVTFVGNRHWTFRHRERTGMGRETVIFFVLNGVGVLIQQACLELAKHEFGRHDKLTLNVAFLVGVGLATMFRFWSYRKFVWLDQSAGPSAGSTASYPPGPRPGGYESREPALVPPEPMPQAAPVRGPEQNGHVQSGYVQNGYAQNGYTPNGQLQNGQLPGRARTGGRHARPR